MGFLQKFKRSKEKRQEHRPVGDEIKDYRKWAQTYLCHADKDHGIEAVSNLNSEKHADLLKKIVIEDPDLKVEIAPEVRIRALNRLDGKVSAKIFTGLDPQKDKNFLTGVASRQDLFSKKLRIAALQQLEPTDLPPVLIDLEPPLLIDIAADPYAFDKTVRRAVITLHSGEPFVGYIAGRLDPSKDRDLLLAIASDSANCHSARLTAISAMDDDTNKALFKKIAVNDADKALSLTVIEKFDPTSDEQTLVEIARTTKDFWRFYAVLQQLDAAPQTARQPDLEQQIPSSYLYETIKNINQWGQLNVDGAGFDFGTNRYENITDFLKANGFSLQASAYKQSDPTIDPLTGTRLHTIKKDYSIQYQGAQLGTLKLCNTPASSSEEKTAGFTFDFDCHDAFSRSATELLLLYLAKGLGNDQVFQWLTNGAVSLVARLKGIPMPKILHMAKMQLHTWSLLSRPHLKNAKEDLLWLLNKDIDNPGALTLLGYAAMALDCLENHVETFEKASAERDSATGQIAKYFLFLSKIKSILAKSGMETNHPDKIERIYKIGNTLAKTPDYAAVAKKSAVELGFDIKAYFEYSNCIIVEINNQGILRSVT